jgi:hypothetical protein
MSRDCNVHRSFRLLFLVVAFALPVDAQDVCPEVGPLLNHNGGGTVVCPCFVQNEEAGAVFDVPEEEYPIEILRIGIGWGSQFGGAPQSLEQSIRVYGAGLPNPGAPIYQLEGPVFTDGAINEFNVGPLPGEIRIDSGPFLVSLAFFNVNAGQIFNPSVIHDGNGCVPGRNAVKAIPGGWRDACALGVTGNWVFQIVYRSLECGGMKDETEFIRGDDNVDGTPDLSDAVFSLGVLFTGELPLCLEAMDSNDDNQHDVSDPVYSLNFLFLGGPAPAAPYPFCGDDTGAIDLGCESPPEICL